MQTLSQRRKHSTFAVFNILSHELISKGTHIYMYQFENNCPYKDLGPNAKHSREPIKLLHEGDGISIANIIQENIDVTINERPEKLYM